ncbi:MAG: S8 family serine peptidase [Acidobacteriota bacterium]|nr:S8 family serine peptidase [Acidobacteriota bacterium]
MTNMPYHLSLSKRLTEKLDNADDQPIPIRIYLDESPALKPLQEAAQNDRQNQDRKTVVRAMKTRFQERVASIEPALSIKGAIQEKCWLSGSLVIKATKGQVQAWRDSQNIPTSLSIDSFDYNANMLHPVPELEYETVDLDDITTLQNTLSENYTSLLDFQSWREQLRHQFGGSPVAPWPINFLDWKQASLLQALGPDPIFPQTHSSLFLSRGPQLAPIWSGLSSSITKTVYHSRQLVGGSALSLEGEGVVVAVLDYGVAGHQDFIEEGTGASRLLAGLDVTNNQVNAPSDEPHGTLIAGLIGSSVTGVAPKAQILPITISSSPIGLAHAMEHALEKGAHVICLADGWGRWSRNTEAVWWRRVCESLLAAGVLHATAAGNEGKSSKNNRQVPEQITCPADSPPPIHPLDRGASSAIACGAYVPSTGKPAETNSVGPVAWGKRHFTTPYDDFPYPESGLAKPDLFAPGAELATSDHGEKGHVRLGPASTSAATAVTAGCLALLAQASLGRGRKVAPEEAFEALKATAQPFSSEHTAGYAEQWGHRIRVDHAYRYGAHPSRRWW